MYRTYSLILTSLSVALTLVVLAVGFQHQPLAGDQTRLGGYAENDFGWNGAEEVFTPPLAHVGDSAAQYDIMVLGDSFSSRTSPDRQTPAGGYWTDFLARETGSSVGVFKVNPPDIETFLREGSFATHPPKWVIFEIVERRLVFKLASGPRAAAPSLPKLAPSLASTLPGPVAARAAVPAFLKRNISTGWRDSLPDETIDYLFKASLRLLSYNTTSVLKYPLSRSDLFTSRRSSELLVLEEDLTKAGWTAADLEKVRTRLLSLQNLIEANGQTRFLFVVPPDKSSAYAEYLPPGSRLPDTQEKFATAGKLNFLRLDRPLKAAIAAGQRDIYLPNDTHWSSRGSQIVAQTVAEYLRNHDVRR